MTENVSLPPLTVLEEFLLLALDDSRGEWHPLPPAMFDCATVGALLMDLTLRNRIDNDLNDIFVIDGAPTGDNLLDPLLQLMSMAPILTPHPIVYWLDHFSAEAPAYRERALRRLEKRGIIKCESHKILWAFGARRYPTVNVQETREVKSRILDVVLGKDIPAPCDVMLVGLAEACDVFRFILAADESENPKPRIAEILRLDLIGQALVKSVANIDRAVVPASGFR